MSCGEEMAIAKASVDEGRRSTCNLLAMPRDLLAMQLRCCSAAELARFSIAAAACVDVETYAQSSLQSSRQAVVAKESVPLICHVVRLVLEEVLSTSGCNLDDVPALLWPRIYHFLCCTPLVPLAVGIRVGHRQTAAYLQHICTARPKFVRCGWGHCELRSIDVAIDCALVAPTAVWYKHLTREVAAGCWLTREVVGLPVPASWTVRANVPLDAVAPVTHSSQLFAVTHLKWGEGLDDEVAATPHSLDSLTFDVAAMNARNFAQVARHLNTKGECAIVRTHQIKLHLLSTAQIQILSHSNHQVQPLLAQALLAFGGITPSLWALVYTKDDPGFYCFN